jgi:hypothetical protein
MKDNFSFYLDSSDTGFIKLQDFMRGVENIEEKFNVEFATGVENNKFLFLSDFENNNSSELLEKYDGCVLPQVFRYKNKTYNTSKTPIIFEISYDEDTREYSKSKIIKV